MRRSDPILLSCLLWAIGTTVYSQSTGDAVSMMSQIERRIRATLDEETSIEFIESPLEDICDYLADFHEIAIQIDSRALEEAGLGPDMPITGNLRRVSLRSALNLVLTQHGLAWSIRDESVLITTEAAARANATVRVYNVTDLLPDGGSSEHLVEALNSVLPSQDPDDTIPSIQIAAYQQLILVRATERKLYELDNLLTQIRAGIRGPTTERRQPAKAAGKHDPFAKPARPSAVRKEDPFAPSKGDPFGGGAAGKPSAKTDDPFNE